MGVVEELIYTYTVLHSETLSSLAKFHILEQPTKALEP